MLGSGFFAILFSAGVAAWVYNKMSRHTGGGNAKPALIAAAVVGIIALIVFFTVFKYFLHE